MSLQDLEEWAGKSAKEIVEGALEPKELLEFLWECVGQDDLYDIVHEICHTEGYVDWERVKEDADDQKYQEWKERDID
tara:strand:+ start:3122 stop:3355 length:234 start_codon:yes stop_codon:yes gene_type:complete